MAISDHDYNTARGMLIAANSNTARNSHPKHTGGRGSPNGHGEQLLREARDEFNMMNPVARDEGRAVVVAAAAQMGIPHW